MRQQPKIQTVELDSDYLPLHCPFCGTRVVLDDEDTEQDAATEGAPPCPHTLFLETPDGFEFQSPRFTDNVGMDDEPENEIDCSLLTDDEMAEAEVWDPTTEVTLPNAIRFCISWPAPSGFYVVVGFAPLEE